MPWVAAGAAYMLVLNMLSLSFVTGAFAAVGPQGRALDVLCVSIGLSMPAPADHKTAQDTVPDCCIPGGGMFAPTGFLPVADSTHWHRFGAQVSTIWFFHVSPRHTTRERTPANPRAPPVFV